MDLEQATKIIGYQCGNKVYIKNMVRALKMFSWSNTPEQWQRLAAGEVVLKKWPAYQALCQAKRDAKFK